MTTEPPPSSIRRVQVAVATMILGKTSYWALIVTLSGGVQGSEGKNRGTCPSRGTRRRALLAFVHEETG